MSASRPGSARLPALDSLRGLAAISVAFSHSAGIFSVTGIAAWPFIAIGTIFHPIAAVIVFFVLSGFVLTRALERSPDLKAYAIGRIFRLYPPFLLSVLIFWIAVNTLFVPMAGSDHTAWASTIAMAPTPTDVWRNLLFLDFHANFVTWTIAVEFLGSALLPVIIWLGRKSSPEIVFIALVLLSTVTQVVTPYDYMFAAGCLLARRDITKIASPWFLVGAAVAILIFEGIWPSPDWIWKILITLAAMAVVGAAAAKPSPVLLSRPLVAVGLVSYSFYLLHPVALYAVFVIATALGLSGAGANWFVAGVSIPMALAGAVIAQRWIEVPSIALGKRLLKPRTVKVSIQPVKP